MTAFWSAIINGAILSALFSFIVWLALRVTPRRALNAATRYAIWWIVLLATVVLPLSYVEWHANGHTARPLPSRTTSAREPQWDPLTAPGQSSVKRTIRLPIEIPASQWLLPILMLWIAASLLLLARVFISYGALFRRSARAVDAPPELNATITGAIHRRIRLAISTEIAIPMATGPLRPVILIPSTLLTMSADDLEQIALHEAAHLARRDDYALFAQRVIEALFALHPVVRWLTREIDLEREIACDDIVVGSTDRARTYADCLTRTVVLCGGVRTSLAAANVPDSRSHLSRRIELLVDRSRSARAGLLGLRLALIAIPLTCAAGLLARTPLLFAFAVPRVAASAPEPAIIDPPMKAPLLRTPERPYVAQAQGPAFPAPKDPPSAFEQQRQAGLEQLKAGQFDAAIATFQGLVAQAPNDQMKADILAVMSEAYRNLGDSDKSIAMMEQVSELLPNSPKPLAQIGLLYDAKGDKARARQYYERTLGLDPNNPLVLNNLAYLLSETGGNLDQALIYARTAQERLPAFLEVDDTVGWIYLKKNMPDIAIAEFRKLLDARPDNPEYRYHYALALYQEGNLPDALKECRTALANKPSARDEADIRALMDKIAPMSDTPVRPPVLPK